MAAAQTSVKNVLPGAAPVDPRPIAPEIGEPDVSGPDRGDREPPDPDLFDQEPVGGGSEGA
jgi:hypothetical protein